ncbi:phosphoadenylyl-sulfate reductase [Bacillus songklensis]|uniref:Adenosine 5'-phosphosulfate reductase n=1 Tax=Bacillus songklensis TaxID=1069116 RepID=A0ABV8B350_9BACI
MGSVLTYERWDFGLSERLMSQMKHCIDVIKWAYSEYGDKIVYACSFGAEGVVLVDLISKVNKKAKIVFLDTELHFKETYDLIDKIKRKYPSLNIQLVKPSVSLEEQAKLYGSELWKYNPNYCCYLRKIAPLTEQLSGMEAWMTGLRRDQSSTRSHLKFINKDDRFKLVKVCPIIDWTWEDVWNYIRINDLPYNELHDRHYPSIGCEMCTLPTTEAAGLRAGRWAHSEKTECGLHQVR